MIMLRTLQITLCTLAVAATAAMAAPVRPSDDAQVLLAVEPQTPSDELATLRAALADDPANLVTATGLARRLIEQGRKNGDPRAYGQAQAALTPWWSSADTPDDVLILRATIRQAFHQFAPALADLDRVIAGAPQNTQARFSRAFIRMVTGEYRSASEDCAAMQARNATVIREICTARLGALTGQGEASRQRLQRVIALLPESNGMLNFAKALEAEIAISLGDQASAENIFQTLTSQPDPGVAVLTAYADLVLAAGQPQKVITITNARTDADALLLRNVIAAKQLGDPRLVEWSKILEDRFAAAAASGNRVHQREEARYLLAVRNDATAALALATENWATQKEPADAELLLAAAIAAERPEAALPVRQFIAANSLEDARLTPLLNQLATIEASQ